MATLKKPAISELQVHALIGPNPTTETWHDAELPNGRPCKVLIPYRGRTRVALPAKLNIRHPDGQIECKGWNLYRINSRGELVKMDFFYPDEPKPWDG